MDKVEAFSLQAAQRRGALMPLVMVATEATYSRSSITSSTNLCMLHVLTGVRSRRVLRMWFDLLISSSQRARTLLDAAPHRRRAAGAARDGGCSAWAVGLPSPHPHPVAAAVLDGGHGGLARLLAGVEDQRWRPLAQAGRV